MCKIGSSYLSTINHEHKKKPQTEEEGRVGDLAEYPLPELTRRGIMDIVEVPSVFD